MWSIKTKFNAKNNNKIFIFPILSIKHEKCLILKKHIEELLRFSTAMTGSQDDAGDLVSSAMEKILTKYPNVRKAQNFLS